MAFDCPNCGIELPGKPEHTKDCFFCEFKFAGDTGQAAAVPETTQKPAVISITGHECNSKGGYNEARSIINEWHKKESYRKMAKRLGVKRKEIDSKAAALCAVANGDENQPGVLVLLGLKLPTKEIEYCPVHKKFHEYDCQKQIVKPKPPPRPKRKRRPRITISKTDAASAAQSIRNLASSEFRQELIRELSGE